MPVEIFRTSIDNYEASQRVVIILQSYFPRYKINVDLDDCDRILRVEADKIQSLEIIQLVRQLGFFCELLE